MLKFTDLTIGLMAVTISFLTVTVTVYVEFGSRVLFLKVIQDLLLSSNGTVVLVFVHVTFPFFGSLD